MQLKTDSDHSIPSMTLKKSVLTAEALPPESVETMSVNSHQQTVSLKDKQCMDYNFTDHIPQQNTKNCSKTKYFDELKLCDP